MVKRRAWVNLNGNLTFKPSLDFEAASIYILKPHTAAVKFSGLNYSLERAKGGRAEGRPPHSSTRARHAEGQCGRSRVATAMGSQRPHPSEIARLPPQLLSMQKQIKQWISTKPLPAH